MSFLRRSHGTMLAEADADQESYAPSLAGKFSPLIGRCSNPRCQSGWLHLLRQRSRPIFEGGWTCSAECTEERLQFAVRRELVGGLQTRQQHRHRIPLGLLMLEKGWITPTQLRRAVTAQRESPGKLRIGEWLVRQGATDAALVTRALSMQWGCPILSGSSGLVDKTRPLPRLFVEAFGVLPIEGTSSKALYLGFEQSVDRALAYSVERIEGVRAECGVVQSSEYKQALSGFAAKEFPPVQIAEAASDFAAAHILAKSIERAQPISSRLVRVHEWLWLRMFLASPRVATTSAACMRDVLCTLTLAGSSRDQQPGR